MELNIVHSMNDEKYQKIVEWHKYGALPAQFSSTKGNFLSEARKYELKEKNLWRDGKVVLRIENMEEVYRQCHQHTGRDKHSTV